MEGYLYIYTNNIVLLIYISQQWALDAKHSRCMDDMTIKTLNRVFNVAEDYDLLLYE